MASLPTNFSVTQTLRTPISNPKPTLDKPVPAGAKPSLEIEKANAASAVNATLLDGADIIGSLSIPDIDDATAYTPESIGIIDTPSAASVIAQPSTDAPSVANSVAQPPADTPSAASVQPQYTAPTPSALSASSGTATTPPFPLNHARILWDNLLENYESVTATAGVNPELAIVPNTFQRWSFTSGSTESIVITLPTNIDMDTFCIGAHNLGILSPTDFKFSYSSSTTGGFTAIAPFKTPKSSANMVHTISPVSVRRLLVEVSISPIREKHIGYISAGIALQMQRPFFNGHTPITDADVTQYYSNRTESGEIIGQQILRQGFETSAAWQNIDDTWYRTYFSPFKQAAKLRPFFFAWNLLEYPDDVGFCRISQDISAPMQNGTATKRSMSMNLLGAG